MRRRRLREAALHPGEHSIVRAEARVVVEATGAGTVRMGRVARLCHVRPKAVVVWWWVRRVWSSHGVTHPLRVLHVSVVAHAAELLRAVPHVSTRAWSWSVAVAGLTRVPRVARWVLMMHVAEAWVRWVSAPAHHGRGSGVHGPRVAREDEAVFLRHAGLHRVVVAHAGRRHVAEAHHVAAGGGG